MKIGILAFQGSVKEHIDACERLGMQTKEVRLITDLDACDALILPGGESTVISKFLTETGLRDAIIKRVGEGMPVYGTCAGAILLSKKVIQESGSITVEPLGLIEITIERNAYGRQSESFKVKVPTSALATAGKKVKNKEVDSVFIRAPKIIEVGPDVEVLAEHNSDPVLCRQGNVLISTFHPELSDGESVVHGMLKEMLKS